MELDQDQKEEFIKFVDAHKDVIRDKQHKFQAQHLLSGYTVINHQSKDNIEYEMFTIDFEALCDSGLFDIKSSKTDSGALFIINSTGLRIYEDLKNERLTPFQEIEKTIIDYLKSSNFIDKYPKAYGKWSNAETLYLKEFSNEYLTTIGHLCRETLQEFSDELLKIKSIKNTYEKSKIIEKMKVVVNDHIVISNSKTIKAFLNALINYWGTLSDLIQKQEHNSQKEGETLKIEDARRIVFHTAIIMYEIDKTLC